jgi:hypothetical protein
MIKRGIRVVKFKHDSPYSEYVAYRFYIIGPLIEIHFMWDNRHKWIIGGEMVLRHYGI